MYSLSLFLSLSCLYNMSFLSFFYICTLHLFFSLFLAYTICLSFLSFIYVLFISFSLSFLLIQYVFLIFLLYMYSSSLFLSLSCLYNMSFLSFFYICTLHLFFSRYFFLL